MSNSIQTRLQQDTAKIIATLRLDAQAARIEVQILLQHVLQVNRAYLLAYLDRSLSPAEQTQYNTLLKRRLRGEPIAYILGAREFFGLSLQLNSHTLIPRPETELLVEKALQLIPATTALTPRYQLLDLGTGSGAIALAIARHRPHINIVASDFSSTALTVARNNARRLNIANITFLSSDWYAQLAGLRFDLIVSNPPYIAADDPHLQRGDLRFEPLSALASGADGLQDIRQIIAKAYTHLKPDGQLWLEHSYNQAAQVRAELQQAGFKDVSSVRDLAGIERVSGGR